MSRRKISIRELIVGIIGGFLSYVLIAVLNISNEDIYNWDMNLIFSEGGILNIFALLLLWIWYLFMALWILSLLFRIIKQIR